MPRQAEVDMVNEVFHMIGGWIGTTVILIVVCGVGFGVIYYWVTRSGKPQEDLARSIVGSVGRALTRITRTEGRIDINGQQMRALSSRPLEAGTEVRVIEIDGLIAKVIPADQQWPPPDMDEKTGIGGPPDFDALGRADSSEDGEV